MRKILLLLFLSFIFQELAIAQDLIIKRNGDELQAKVTKVTSTEIEFKKWANLEGPVYSIPKSEVFMIKYQNGDKDVFNEETGKVLTPKIEEQESTVPAINTLPPISSSGFTPALNLTNKEIIDKVYEANPYTLFKKGAMAEYCFYYGDKQTKFGGAVTYVVQTIADVQITGGLYIAYYKQDFYNKKHEPSRGISAQYKATLYPTEIDIYGTYHWTHDIHREEYIIESKRGFAALIKANMQEDEQLQTNNMIWKCKNQLGPIFSIKSDYQGLRFAGYETITTPAGTFDCIKLSGTVIFNDAKSTDNIWFSKGIGIVKHESYFGKGKKPSVMILNKVENI